MRTSAARVALSFVLLALACGDRSNEDPAPSCAQLGTLRIGPADIRALRAHLKPAPPLPGARELALDIRASEHQQTGELGALPWPEAVRAYRARVREARGDGAGLAALRAELAEVRRELGERSVACESGGVRR